MVKKIILEIDGKEIAVSPEEARKLFGELQRLFGESYPVTVLQPWTQPDFTITSTPHFPPARTICNNGVVPLTVGMN